MNGDLDIFDMNGDLDIFDMNGDLDIFDMNGDLDIFDMTRGSFRTAREPMRPSNAFCYFSPPPL